MHRSDPSEALGRRGRCALIPKAALAAVVLSLLCSATSAGSGCTVPGSHASLQAAIDDPACSSIQAAALTYQESLVVRRSLTLAGPAAGGAVVEGSIALCGTIVVYLSKLRIVGGCPEDPLRATAGAQLVGTDLDVVRDGAAPCPGSIFADGFESGDITAWSSASSVTTAAIALHRRPSRRRP